jgi:hypothetical protein
LVEDVESDSDSSYYEGDFDSDDDGDDNRNDDVNDVKFIEVVIKAAEKESVGDSEEDSEDDVDEWESTISVKTAKKLRQLIRYAGEAIVEGRQGDALDCLDHMLVVVNSEDGHPKHQDRTPCADYMSCFGGVRKLESLTETLRKKVQKDQK